MKKQLGSVASAIGGVMLGVLLMWGWQQRNEAVTKEFEAFAYGVTDSTLVGTDVKWQEYPQFRSVQFYLNGELTVDLPHGGEIVPEGLVDGDTFREVSREPKELSNGNAVLEYDVVTYLFENAQIKANLPNVYNAESDATYGYELSCEVENDTIVVAYSVPMCNEFCICSKVESTYWSYPQNLDFELLKLSQTYPEKDVTGGLEKAPCIVIEKAENGYDLLIRNEGEEGWNYSCMLPSVEVFNEGVWMELETLLADPLVGSSIGPGETQELKVPKSSVWSMPYFAPGIYRMVVYGDNDTYAVTESFVIP